jgi:hypothetical protein
MKATMSLDEFLDAAEATIRSTLARHGYATQSTRLEN